MAEKTSDENNRNPAPCIESSSNQDTPFPKLSDQEWATHRQSGDFDYIVIGSSFCALGFVSQMLEKNPTTKILIIERGDYDSPSYFENLKPDALGDKEKKDEKKPWKFCPSENEHTITEGARGLIYLFGGRSPFWKAWSPEPTKENMTGWPPQAVDKVLEYFPAAAKLLNVVAADKIGADKIGKEENKVFGSLQDDLFKQLSPKYGGIQHAPLAVETNRHGNYQKYSVLKPLLDILKKENVKAVLNCTVRKINNEGNRAISLETSRESVSIGQAKVILAMSTLPSTTLMLNSFPESPCPSLKKIGKKFTGHFASYVYARIPIPPGLDKSSLHVKPQIAALHIPGKCRATGHQYHIQLTAIAVGEKQPNYDVMKNLLKTPKKEMLESCKNHLVLVCATLGQLDHENSENYFCLSDVEGRDITENTDLHFATNEKDKSLWNTMDEATYEVIRHLSPEDGEIEYWNKCKDESKRTWQAERPEIRWEYLVHPASTMWLGEGDEAPVDLGYRFRGVDNVYLTGGALWPTAGSWNPTCTMTAMAMHLADILLGN